MLNTMLPFTMSPSISHHDVKINTMLTNTMLPYTMLLPSTELSQLSHFSEQNGAKLDFCFFYCHDQHVPIRVTKMGHC